jgi:hypothetical protein
VTTPTRAARRRPSEVWTADGIYGVVVGAAVMAASHAPNVLAVAVAVLVTLVVYWAAERYARVVADRVARGRRPAWSDLTGELTDGWEIVTTSTLPLLVLVGAGLLGASVPVAVLAGLISSTALLCVVGWEIGRVGLSTRERLVSAAAAGLLGVCMIVLKVALH